MKRIFISFVHEDESVASCVKRLIEKELGVDVFLSSDKSQIYAGDSWLEKITTALKEADVVLLMLSQRSLRRPWVNFEAGGAWLLSKTVIPCCYGNLSGGAPAPSLFKRSSGTSIEGCVYLVRACTITSG